MHKYQEEYDIGMSRKQGQEKQCGESRGGSTHRVLIESQQDQRSITTLARVELWILQKRNQEILQPRTSIVNGGIMSIVHHVRGDEVPLRNSVCLHIGGEVVKVADTGGPGCGVGDSVVDDEWRVFALEVLVLTGGGIAVSSLYRVSHSKMDKGKGWGRCCVLSG